MIQWTVTEMDGDGARAMVTVRATRREEQETVATPTAAIVTGPPRC
jgi:hypothetical protein